MDNFRFWLSEKSDQHTAEVFPFLFISISSSYSFLYFMAPSIFFPYPLKKNKKMIQMGFLSASVASCSSTLAVGNYFFQEQFRETWGIP